MRRLAAAGCTAALICALPLLSLADDSDRLLTIDHYVRVTSTVPSMAGQPAQLYVRERVAARTVLRPGDLADRVVLFVHGAGTPAEVAFDVPYGDYSWMGHLARHGFDVFSVDMTGYGPSTRPPPMNDPCNLASDRQTAFVPSLLRGPCAASYPGAATTIASDWHDIGAAVDYIRALRRVERVSMVAWSLGGPRSGGYAAAHPEKVHRLVWLAPAYRRSSPADPPAALPVPGVVFNTQSRADFLANWDRQIGCPAQYEPEVADAVWASMLDSDPVGATWGPGVRRAPQTSTWGWNAAAVATMRTPALMVAAAHDGQIAPALVRELYADYGAPEKVLVDLGCASHNAMWEKAAHTTLFGVTLEWLQQGTVNGSTSGVVRLGY
jgi:pimeloyl-ACP methyl ester carboxylesterase